MGCVVLRLVVEIGAGAVGFEFMGFCGSRNHTSELPCHGACVQREILNPKP